MCKKKMVYWKLRGFVRHVLQRRNRRDCCNTQESKCTGVNITIPSRFVSRGDVGILAQLMRDLKLEQVQGTLLSALKKGSINFGTILEGHIGEAWHNDPHLGEKIYSFLQITLKICTLACPWPLAFSRVSFPRGSGKLHFIDKCLVSAAGDNNKANCT